MVLTRRKEILDLVSRNFDQYSWSLRTLDQRLRHFKIFYHDCSVTVEQVRQAIGVELKGPGKLLGNRAMQQKIQKYHGLVVPRDLVYAAIYDQDPTALERRAPDFKTKKDKGNFTTLYKILLHRWLCSQWKILLFWYFRPCESWKIKVIKINYNCVSFWFD